MWAKLKSFDIHSKALEGVHKQTLLGAVLTLVTSVLVLTLIFSELSTFFKIDVVSRMVVDKNARLQSVRLEYDVSFPNIHCDRLSFLQEVTRGNVRSNEPGKLVKTPIIGATPTSGCRMTGILLTDETGGDFRLAVSPEPNAKPDLTHSITHVTFYPTQGPLATDRLTDIARNLSRSEVIVPKDTTIYQYALQIVPTQYKTLYGELSFINQYFVNEKVISADQVLMSEMTMGINLRDFTGIIFTYDFNPVMLYMEERREKIIDFVSNLFGIVGGVITVLSLIERLLQQSTKVIMGKND